MKRRTATWSIAALLLGMLAFLAPAVTATTGTMAYASGMPEICGNGGSGYCLNDWNNAGSYVKMYYGGNYTNDEYQIEYETLACNSGHATKTCPINVPGIDPTGALIFEILNPRDGACVATDGNAAAIEGTCADLSGNGGARGVTELLFRSQICTLGYQLEAMNRYWTQTDSTPVWLESGGNIGLNAYYARFANGADATCWGAVTSLSYPH